MSQVSRYRRIVVPLDGSGWSRRAVPHAADIARANGSEIVLLHVFRPPTADYSDMLALAGQEALVEQLRESVEQTLNAIASELRSEDLNVRVQILEGAGAASAICDFVNEQQVDLVVMSTHGRTGIARFLFGSVARKVMEGITAPVLMIHPDRE